MDSGFADIVMHNESDCRLLPGEFTATARTKTPLRIPAAITIYFIREITCRWVIYRPPAVCNCATKHWLSPHSDMNKDLAHSHASDYFGNQRDVLQITLIPTLAHESRWVYRGWCQAFIDYFEILQSLSQATASILGLI